MAKTIANVLVGTGTLYVRQPNDAIAEWSTVTPYVGTYSAKLYKGGSGNAGSTHLQIIPPTGITMQIWNDNPAFFSYWHKCSAITANFSQFEFKFEDPNSSAWAEITAVPNQAYDGSIGGAGPNWVIVTLAAGDLCGWGGHTELDTPFFDWSLTPATDVQSGIMALISALDGNACAPEDWILTRVRIELWEPSEERTEWIDSVTINNVLYAIEPGGNAPGLSLSSPFVEVGYTEDGVTMEYAPEITDVMVHEETFPVGAALTSEALTITCNMAEASLANLNNAIAGAVRSGNIITVGAGVLKEMNLKIEGTDPDGFLCAYHFPKAVASGTVGMSFKKNEKIIIPVSFKVLKSQDEPAFTLVYNAA